MGWEDAMGQMGLGGIGNAYKRAALQEQSDMINDLYARGYRGVPTDQIEVKRGGLGSLLQSAGILSPPEPEPMTEYQKYIMDRGARAHQMEDLQMEASKFDLTNAKDRARFQTIQEAAKAFDLTGGVESPELVGSWGELADDYGGIVKEGRERKVKKESKEALDEMSKLAQIEFYRSGTAGTRGGRDPEAELEAKAQAAAIRAANNPINAPLMRQYEYFWGSKDRPTGAMKQAIKSGDRTAINKLIEGDQYEPGYRQLYQKLYLMYRNAGVPDKYIPGLLIPVPGQNESYRTLAPEPESASAAGAGRQPVADAGWNVLYGAAAPDMNTFGDRNPQWGATPGRK